jgi:hypothetical protein
MKSEIIDDKWHYVILHVSGEAVGLYIDNHPKCSVDENFALEKNESFEVTIRG